MARRYTVTCDRCSKETGADDLAIITFRVNRNGIYIRDNELDVCLSCLNDIERGWLKNVD